MYLSFLKLLLVRYLVTRTKKVTTRASWQCGVDLSFYEVLGLLRECGLTCVQDHHGFHSQHSKNKLSNCEPGV